MRKKIRFNRILTKLVAMILLAIILIMYPITSFATGEYIKKQFEEKMPEDEERTNEEDDKEKDNKKKEKKYSTSDENSLDWANPFSTPQVITSKFGNRGGIATAGGATPDFHTGTDLGAVAGTPVLAPSSGTVIEVGFETYGGNFLHVERSDGYSWFICHLQSQPNFQVGDKITIGQEVAYVGSTGLWTTGPHLHFEIRKNGTPIDAETIIDFSVPGISKGPASSSTDNATPEIKDLYLRDYKRMIQDGAFFYKGVPEGHFVKSQFNLWKWIVKLIADIVDYLLGIATIAFRLGILGFGILAETMLTDAFDSLVVKNKGSGTYRKNNVGFYTDSKRTINVENIFFNRVEVLNVNFFESKDSVKRRLLKYSPTGLEVDELYGDKNTDDITEGTEKKVETDKIVATDEIDELEDGPLLIIKDYFAQLFLIFYSLALLLLLAGLMVNAIMSTVESVGTKKADYKKRAKEWLKAFIEAALLIIYMILILQVHTWLIDLFAKLADAAVEKGIGTFVQTDMGRNYTIMETLRTRAYSFKFSIGLPATIMYIVLMYFTFRFLLIYIKRFLVVFFLSLLGPVLMVYDLIIRTIKGESSVRIDWIKEYTFNVLIQIVHALIYVIFIPLAYNLASSSIMGFILMFTLLKFLLEADKIVRKVFNITGAKKYSTLTNVLEKSSFKDYASAIAVTSLMGDAKDTKSFVKKYVKPIMKPARAIAGTVGSAAFRGTYNLVQSAREKIKDNRISKGKPEISERQLKREEKRNKEVADILKLKGYSDEEIKDRLSPDGKVKLTEKEKDRIRLLESSKVKKTGFLKRKINNIKYTGRNFKRVLSDMGTVDEKGRKRIQPGEFTVDPETGKIKLNDGLSDKFKKSVIKEFNLGTGKEGLEEYEKVKEDLIKAGKIGLIMSAGTLFLPIAFADPSIDAKIFAAFQTNFQFNSKSLGTPKKRKTAVVIKEGLEEDSKEDLKEDLRENLKYKGNRTRKKINKEILNTNKEIYKDMKKERKELDS